ncbi:TIGR01459 family HAD-type hydrolase [Acetobacteraceae bacterium KSS8]|uniref:TIGR01459 family HAD-type hydrolase n=1 Tax=Endosaccharibacter trunci TaxID=2812733 RepID=A0ABT1W1W9_9PROT|nr:TIGR01459 family HAD-type hydrolase [Acetobacteraceae bacterium KSS8]
MSRSIAGLSALAPAYDGFIVDLWGVVHDGIDPYPGAVECLHTLRDAGKRVVLLSNAPRRLEPVRETLRRIGVPDACYDGLLTSGEATRMALLDPPDDWFRALGRRCWHLGPAKDANLFDNLALERTDGPDGADFVLNTGPDDTLGESDPAPYLPDLRRCKALSLPMLCANPDLEVVRAGKRIICAGWLARLYAEMGGVVRQIGKPDPAIYQPVLAMLGTERARTLAIGDSLATDIAGAKAAGIDSLWVLGGIHGAALDADSGLMERELLRLALSPVAAIARLAW